jgi:hypothetical protein
VKTALMTPTVEELEALPAGLLIQLAQTAELAIAKPYFLDRLKAAIFLKEGV